jgi:ribonuclease-3
VFLDAGYDAVRVAITHTYGSALTNADAAALQKDPKSRLQELLHARRRSPPEYRLVGTHGPKQRQTFQVECVVGDLDLSAAGSGSSRRAAEQSAAENLLKLVEP